MNFIYDLMQKKPVIPLLVFITVFLAYLSSMSRTVGLEDDGLFILSSYYNGIAHPPGYPLYTLLGHLATYVPLGSIAARVHGLSALFGALGCVFLWLISYRLLPHRGMATVVALGYGFSRVFWSQAIIAEVYSLNVLLFFMLAWLCLRYRDNADGRHQHRLSLLLGLVYGLGLSNHWPLFILSTPLLLAWLWPVRGTVLRQLPVSVLGLLVGLLPYAWLVYRSQMQPEFSFYGPIESLREFWFYVSREGYAGIDQSASAGWWDKGQFMLFVLRETAMQFGPFGVVFVVWGVVRQWRHWPLSISVGLLLGYLGNTLVLIGLLGFDYDPLHEAIFRVYPLIAYGICAVWLGLGVLTLVKWLQERDKQAQWRLAPMALMLVILATTLLGNMTHNYRANDTWAEDYARAILESVDENSIIFAFSDMSAGSLFYTNQILAVRPDVEIYSGLSISNRQLHREYTFTESDRDRLLDDFIRESDRSIYLVEQNPTTVGMRHHGLFFQAAPALSSKQMVYQNNRIALNYLLGIVSGPIPSDTWKQIQYWQRVANLCVLTTGLQVFSRSPTTAVKLDQSTFNQCRSYYGLISMVQVLIQQQEPDWKLVSLLLEEAQAFTRQASRKEDLAQWYNLKATSMARQNNLQEALDNFRLSARIWASPDNTALRQLNKMEK